MQCVKERPLVRTLALVRGSPALPEARTIDGAKLPLIGLICFNNFIQKGGGEFPWPVSEGSPAATGLSARGDTCSGPRRARTPLAPTKASDPSVTEGQVQGPRSRAGRRSLARARPPGKQRPRGDVSPSSDPPTFSTRSLTGRKITL